MDSRLWAGGCPVLDAFSRAGLGLIHRIATRITWKRTPPLHQPQEWGAQNSKSKAGPTVQAKGLLAASGHEFSRPSPLVLVYDSSDAELRAVAERVAVNLREVGIVIQVAGQTKSAKGSVGDVRLIRHRKAQCHTTILSDLKVGPPKVRTYARSF